MFGSRAYFTQYISLLLVILACIIGAFTPQQHSQEQTPKQIESAHKQQSDEQRINNKRVEKITDDYTIPDGEGEVVRAALYPLITIAEQHDVQLQCVIGEGVEQGAQERLAMVETVLDVLQRSKIPRHALSVRYQPELAVPSFCRIIGEFSHERT